MGLDPTTVSRRQVLGAGAVVAAAATGVAAAPAAQATTATATTPVIKKVTIYRVVSYRYNSATHVTTVTKATKATVVARFVGTAVYLKNSHGTWFRVPYVWSRTKRALVFSRYLQLKLQAAAKPKPNPTAGVTVVSPGPFSAVSAYHTTDWARHLLNRAGYGPTDADLAAVRSTGYVGWLEAQMSPSHVSDTACAQVLSRLPAQGAAIWRVKHGIETGTINGWDQYNSVLQDFTVRALLSKRQLLTVMEDFWGNHFNVTIYADGTAESRAHYAYTIRARAFGRFADLLAAVTKHPAMLTYLNNRDSTAEHPNENQGRELLELHTVGVDAGYGEVGVINSARLLTGLGVDSDSGEYAYQPWNHWTGAVKVLGFSHANATDTGGEAAVNAYLSYLAHHPATAQRLARKLAVRFVSDTPSAGLVSLLAKTYLAHDTAIVPVLRVLFSSHEFAQSIGAKVARPFEHLVSTARRMGVTPALDNLDALLQLVYMADDAGHNPFGQPFPTGQPDTADAWESTAATLTRWNNTMSMVAGWYPSDVVRPTLLAAAVGPTLPATHGELLDVVARRMFGRVLAPAHKTAMLAFLGVTADKAVSSSSSAVSGGLPSLVAALLDSPYATLR
ncbi:MAG: DUF1800 family protein [Frankiales bacterium]|nr:DUF1800 family protein [Frankiales bacterium]